jgi:hypothetical protein
MRPVHRLAALVLLGAVLLSDATWADHASVNIGVGLAAGINTESGATLPRGKWSVGVRTEYVEFDEFSDRELVRLREEQPDGDLHSVGNILNASAGLFYGVTDDLTVGLRLPYVRRDTIREPSGGDGHAHGEEADDDHDHAVMVERLGDADGLGDMVVVGQYRFFHRPNAHHVSALFGFKAPTGSTTEKADQGFRLETELQPGSGSWDALFGASYTYSFAPFSFDTNVLYSAVTEGAQNTDLGDIADYNFSLAYRLGGRHEDGDEHDHDHHHDHGHDHEHDDDGREWTSRLAWDAIVEINGEWREKLEISGDVNRNSGGNVVYLSPGIRVVIADRVNLALSVGIPIVTDLNGSQVEPNYRLISGVGVNF